MELAKLVGRLLGLNENEEISPHRNHDGRASITLCVRFTDCGSHNMTKKITSVFV